MIIFGVVSLETAAFSGSFCGFSPQIAHFQGDLGEIDQIWGFLEGFFWGVLSQIDHFWDFLGGFSLKSLIFGFVFGGISRKSAVFRALIFGIWVKIAHFGVFLRGFTPNRTDFWGIFFHFDHFGGFSFKLSFSRSFFL